MISKKDVDYLNDIIHSIDLINNYMKDITKHDFYLNQEKQDAVVNRLMIIGEAAKQLSKQFRNKYTNIPWKNMAGMRDILIHRYHGIDLEIVWEVIKVDIPKIEENLIKIYKSL